MAPGAGGGGSNTGCPQAGDGAEGPGAEGTGAEGTGAERTGTEVPAAGCDCFPSELLSFRNIGGDDAVFKFRARQNSSRREGEGCRRRLRR